MILNKINSFVTDTELEQLNSWVNSSVNDDINLIKAKFKTDINDYEYRTARGNKKAAYPELAFKVHSRFKKWISKYNCSLEFFPSGMPFTFVSYGEGSQAFLHLDPETKGFTTVRFNILLNDNFKGGQFGIVDDNNSFQLLSVNKGDLHFYSATKNKHGISPVVKGRRNIMLMSVLVKEEDYIEFMEEICAENPSRISLQKKRDYP